MCDYNPHSDLKILASAASTDEKRAKAQRRVNNHILGAKGPERLRRLDEVMMSLDRIYWRDKDSYEISDSAVRSLCAALYERRELDLILQAYDAGMLTKGDDQASRLERLGHGQAGPEDLKTDARQWFIAAFYKATGESAERSISFALFLLETIGRFLGKTLNDHRLDEIDARKLLVGSPAMAADWIIHSSAAVPPSELTPAKFWLEQLIEAADSDAAARQALGSVFNVLVSARDDDQCRIIVADDDGPVSRGLIAGFGGMDARELYLNPILVLKPRHNRIVKRIMAENLAASERLRVGADCVLGWFAQRREALLSRAERQISDCQERPRRGFRPNGMDYVEVDVAPLRAAGLRAIIFRAEGCIFPNVRFDLVVLKETPHLVTYPLPPDLSNEAYSLTVAEALRSSLVTDLPALEKLLFVVIADMMHRIIVADEGLRERHGWSKTGGKEGEQRRGHGTVMPPLIRHLPEGWRASDEAKARARDALHCEPPPGFTFVVGHYRQGRIVYDFPSEPTALYGDDDLLAAGDGP